MDAEKNLMELWRHYKWTILLTVGALLFAVSVISYGFFKALFLFACLALGVWGGLTIDKRAAAKRNAEEYSRHD